MKKKALSYYLDLMKSANEKQDWVKAKRFGEIALKKLTKLSYSPLEEYLLYCKISLAYRCLGEYPSALNFLYNANLIATKYHLGPAYTAYTLLRIGHNLSMIQKVNQALRQFQRVEEYYQKYGDNTWPMDKHVHFVNLIYLGYCYLDKNELKQIEEIIEKKLSLLLPVASKLNLRDYYHFKAEYLIALKEYAQARCSLQEFLDISLPLNFPESVLEAKIHLATIDLLEGQLKSVIPTLEILLKEAHQLKFNDYICRLSLLLSKCYLLDNKPDKSANIEKRMKPFLNKLNIDWFYETSRGLEIFYRLLQPIYRTETFSIPAILTNTINRYHDASIGNDIIVGYSAAMQEAYQLVKKIAPTDLPVLIQGETGTGKELIAKAVYENSACDEKTWLALNCNALPETLLENELFGHVKGAFTDAYKEKPGYVELASEGTLFLDEIADMSPAMQQKLLRVLEEKLVWRLGAEKPIPVNTRFLFASNQNIEELVNKKRFRLDLFHRINTIVITLPPLRDRKEDIPLLVQHFLKKYAVSSKSETRNPKSEIAPEALSLLMAYPWPGNVRELENEIKRICLLYPRLNDSVGQADVKTITEEMIATRINSCQSESDKTESISNYSFKTASKLNEDLGLKELKEAYERNIIIETLKKCNGNINKAAQLLKYDRGNLYRKVQQFKISINNK
jgi:DNA-binding NtrC family response regulator